MMKQNKKRNAFELRRGFALLCALVIPVLYMIAIILFMTGNSYGKIFLVIPMGVSLLLLPAVYLVTNVPQDMAEIYDNLLDMVEREKDIKHTKRK